MAPRLPRLLAKVPIAASSFVLGVRHFRNTLPFHRHERLRTSGFVTHNSLKEVSLQQINSTIANIFTFKIFCIFFFSYHSRAFFASAMRPRETSHTGDSGTKNCTRTIGTMAYAMLNQATVRQGRKAPLT